MYTHGARKCLSHGPDVTRMGQEADPHIPCPDFTSQRTLSLPGTTPIPNFKEFPRHGILHLLGLGQLRKGQSGS